MAGLAAGGGLGAEPAEAQDTSLEGVWAAERYELASGDVHQVAGRIFFSATEWQVLFFVMDDGAPRRASAEGGEYTARDGRLVFRHLFHFSQGEAVAGLPASELRWTVASPPEAPEEPTRYDVTDGRLTLHFPSGNRMVFRRGT